MAAIYTPIASCSTDAQRIPPCPQQPSHPDNRADMSPFLIDSTLQYEPQQGVWTYSRGQIAMASPHYQGDGYYYPNYPRNHGPRPSRPRTSSSSSHSASYPINQDAVVLQKSMSTPISSSGRSVGYHYQNRSSALLKQQQQQHYAAGRRERSSKQSVDRPSSQTSTASSAQSPVPSLDMGRRSSITSVSSTVSQNFSIRSGMSINTKLSLSKRLRKVFSMSHLRSPKDGLETVTHDSPNGSLATVHEGGSPEETATVPSRRRSFATLSSLFQKHATISEATPVATTSTASVTSVSSVASTKSGKEKRLSSGDLKQMAQRKKANLPRSDLHVDTESKGRTNLPKTSNARGRLSDGYAMGGPESPSSVTSTHSTRKQQQQHQQPRFMGHSADGLPSPSPSSSTSSHRHMRNDNYEVNMIPPPAVGLHYGLPLHGSPRLRPAIASSSTSSLATSVNLSNDKPRRIQFCPTVQVHETFTAQEYDRTCDPNATCTKLTPMLAMKIKQELNEYKLTDMPVHIESRQYTHFFL